MKKVVLSIIMFAISIALLVGVIIPIAEKARGTGETAYTYQQDIDTQIGTLAEPINK